MGNGLALPHCATDRVDSVTGALGISRHGIDFVCRDGSPANILILLVIPRRSFQEHLHTVSSIARVMRQKTLREAILAARDAKTILHLIETEETKDGLSAAPKKGSTGPR
jgi:mannitol/fructose-specific phosphotransferase system IIA component (Ntr-type)